jgi:hypothetical protein
VFRFVGREEEVEARGCGFSDKAICPDHVDDVVLRKLIEMSLCESACSFCGRFGAEDTPVAAAFDDFMDAFMVGVHNRFVRAMDDAVPFTEGEFVVRTTDPAKSPRKSSRSTRQATTSMRAALPFSMKSSR